MPKWPGSSPTCFFLTAIAFTAGWTAISSLIGYYKSLYGPHMLLYLNLAYFLPSLPTLLLQSLWDARLDSKFGIAKAATVRLCIGLGGSTLICIVYPFYESSRDVLLVLVSLLGLCNSVAFSTSYQIVTHFSTSNSVALTTGFVASGPLVVLAEAALRMGPRPSYIQQMLLFQLVAALTLAGWAAALLLLVRWWGQLQAKADSPESSPLLEDESVVLHSSQHSLDPPGEHHSRYHAAPHSSDQAEAGLIEQQGTGGYEGSDTSRASSCNRDELERGERSAVSLESMGSSQTGRSLSMPSPHAVPEWGYQALAQDIWPAVLALVLSVSTSILVFPFFPYVPSDGRFGDALPQVLFAARVISDMAGRLIPLLGPLSSKQGLLSIAAAKAIMTPIFFLYIGSGFSHYSDWAAVLYITLFWLLSGYVNNCAYVMASCWAPSHATAAKAGGLMALVFQTSSLMALLLAFWIEHRYFAV